MLGKALQGQGLSSASGQLQEEGAGAGMGDGNLAGGSDEGRKALGEAWEGWWGHSNALW